MSDETEIVYGDTVYQNGDKKKNLKAAPLDTIKRKMIFCHQSTFMRTSLMLEMPYQEKFTICADYDFFLWAYRSGHKFEYIPEYVSVFKFGGFSMKSMFRLQVQKTRVRYENKTISRFAYYRLLARITFNRGRRLFLSKEAKRMLDEKRFSSEKGWENGIVEK
jgi:hypothetical protein